MPAYDAFISYSHAKDKPIASALQSVIQKLGKPWYRRRALRVFRDDTSLSATPGLWPTIEKALGQSRYFILLASPEAAVSKWVNKEVAHWLGHNSIDTLLIGVTDGELAWDETTGDFAARENMPLPPALAGRFVAEPKWVDLRPYREGVDKGDAKFTELAADFAAAIHGTPKEDLLSQEVRQQRRALTLAWSAAVSLLVLAGVSTWQWRETTVSRRVAVTEAARADRNFTAAKSTIDTVIFDIAHGLQDIDGMRVETVRRILERAEVAVGRLASRTDNDPEVRRSQVAMLTLFSDIYLKLGATELAVQYARNAVEIARDLATNNAQNAESLDDLSVSLNKVGHGLRKRGDLKGALAAYREGLDIARKLSAKNSGNTRLWRDFSVSDNYVGDVLVELGDLEGALAAYREGLELARKLSDVDPSNTLWRRDVYVSLDTIARVLVSTGDFNGALAMYREGIVIAHDLSSKDPDNTLWQRDITLSLERIGDVLVELGDLTGAQVAYNDGLERRRELGAKDPSNTELQRDLILSLIKTGLVLWKRGDFTAALVVCRESLDIAKNISAKDPSNTQWRHDVLSSLHVVGMTLQSMGDPNGALSAQREGVAIARDLVAKDLSNTLWRRDLSVSLTKVGSLLYSRGNFSGALAAYRESLNIVRELAAKDPGNATWQTDVVASLDYLARAGDDPRERWMEAGAILTRLKSENRLTPEQQGWIGLFESELAKLGPPSSAFSPTVEQIGGTYVGTNVPTRSWGSMVIPNRWGLKVTPNPGEEKITLTLQQSGSTVAAHYETSQGARGKGTGTISGNIISAMTLQSELETCPGSFNASLTFSADTVKWTYTGQDCTGPVQGHGQARKTKVEADALR
jgi:tetratricopeptide (TPR) repeat protein